MRITFSLTKETREVLLPKNKWKVRAFSNFVLWLHLKCFSFFVVLKNLKSSLANSFGTNDWRVMLIEHGMNGLQIEEAQLGGTRVKRNIMSEKQMERKWFLSIWNDVCEYFLHVFLLFFLVLKKAYFEDMEWDNENKKWLCPKLEKYPGGTIDERQFLFQTYNLYKHPDHCG